MDMEEGGGFRDLLPWWADNPPKNAQNGQPCIKKASRKVWSNVRACQPLPFPSHGRLPNYGQLWEISISSLHHKVLLFMGVALLFLFFDLFTMACWLNFCRLSWTIVDCLGLLTCHVGLGGIPNSRDLSC